MTKTDGRFSTVIRVSVRDKFFNEKKKGELINDLLEKHYGSDLMTKEERITIFSSKVTDLKTNGYKEISRGPN